MRGALILSGGRSSRMGKDKGMIFIKDEPLVKIVADRISKIVEEVVVVISKIQNKEIYELFLKDYRLLVEEGDIRAPLVGINYGLKNMKSDYIAILACDSPLVNLKVLEFMFDKVKGYDACIPLWENGRLEPLHAVYQREKTLKATKEALDKGELSNKSFIDKLEKVYYLKVNELKIFDENLFFLLNANTPEELEKVKELLSKGY